MNWSGWGAILLGLAVILGAFGAHGLRGRLDAYSMGIYEPKNGSQAGASASRPGLPMTLPPRN